MRLLVTGGLGFIGSNFINYWIKAHPGDEIINLDKETYAADPWNVKKTAMQNNYTYVKGDVCNFKVVDNLASKCDIIVNFAAESHVDNSISSPSTFVTNNVIGTLQLLEAARRYELRFHQISTDEVYGSLNLDSREHFTEKSRYDPRNPYSASKASSDFLVKSYVNTYGLSATISNCGNNYGPNQHPEKLIPKSIISALTNTKIPIYGTGLNVRDWVHVEDHCRAIDSILSGGRYGSLYLISSRELRTNLEIAHMIVSEIGADNSLLEFVPDRLGHDSKYSIDPHLIESELGWRPRHMLQDTLPDVIRHYRENLEHYLKRADFPKN